jgi:hypothetical protein
MSTEPLPELTGTEQPEVNQASWQAARILQLGAALQALAGEFGISLQLTMQPTAATAPYEKDGLIIEVLQQDPSSYAPGNVITKDACALDSRGIIAAGNLLGRAWGHYCHAEVRPGGDGLAVASERGGHNQGTAQPLPGTPTSKHIDVIVAGEFPGDQNITDYRFIVGGSAKFYFGDLIEQAAFVDPQNSPAYRIYREDGSPAFEITAGGSILCSGLNLFGREAALQQITLADGTTVEAIVLKP